MAIVKFTKNFKSVRPATPDEVAIWTNFRDPMNRSAKVISFRCFTEVKIVDSDEPGHWFDVSNGTQHDWFLDPNTIDADEMALIGNFTPQMSFEMHLRRFSKLHPESRSVSFELKGGEVEVASFE